MFSGSSQASVTIANAGPRVSRSGTYHRSDTHKTSNAFLRNTPAGQYALTPVVTSSATNAPLDFESLRTRLGQTINWGTTNITIPSTATNVPTITFTGRGSRTIANMYLYDVNNTGWDDIGPRVSGSSDLNYGTVRPNVNWVGAATMAKPIGDFHITTPGSYNGNRPINSVLGTFTAYQQNQGLRVRVHNAIIPEPKEYALVFGLFALAFVFFHRWQKKRRQAATTS